VGRLETYGTHGDKPRLLLHIIEHAVFADTQFPDWKFLIPGWLQAGEQLAVAVRPSRVSQDVSELAEVAASMHNPSNFDAALHGPKKDHVRPGRYASAACYSETRPQFTGQWVIREKPTPLLDSCKPVFGGVRIVTCDENHDVEQVRLSGIGKPDLAHARRARSADWMCALAFANTSAAGTDRPSSS